MHANFELGTLTDATFNSRFNQALSKGSETGAFDRPKGPSGPVKLGKGKAVASTDKKAAAPKTEKVEKTEKTEKTEKKAPATKKTVC